MDLEIPGLCDRRVAAADEYLDGSESDERALFRARADTPREQPAHRPYVGRFIYGRGTAQRRESQHRPLDFDAMRMPFPRRLDQITTIVLHSTAGPQFSETDLPSAGNQSSYHRVDEIIANFVVLRDGRIMYTHDLRHVLNVAGGASGVDIEFAGHFGHSLRIRPGAQRLSPAAISAGRRLIEYLCLKYCTRARFIHPHGQVQQGARGGQGNGGKYDSCPGPDVWVNVGEWAVQHLGLTCDRVDPGGHYPNHGISRSQRLEVYRQAI